MVTEFETNSTEIIFDGDDDVDTTTKFHQFEQPHSLICC